MTIFVDDMHMPARVGGIRGNWSHMWTDSDDQTRLHELAKMLGLKRKWFQHEEKYPDAPWLWHYDVTDSVRKKAIQAGATAITTREGALQTGARAKARREAREAVSGV